MYSRAAVATVLDLKAAGLNHCEISRRTGVSRPTIREWCRGNTPHPFQADSLGHGQPTRPSTYCRQCGGEPHRFRELSTAYAYLLGLYLGDGWISRGKRDVYRLRIALDRKYPLIIEECAAAMQAVVPWNKVHRQLTDKNYVEVHAYSKGWPCLFPQHGPGKKHERRIVLAGRQRRLVELWPKLLIRGLIHSDGCRFINTGRGDWEAPRYVFTNFSQDIKDIFCRACEQLELHWTAAPPKSIYVSRKADVARLDEFVGPKR